MSRLEGTERILVVEDDDSILEFTHRILTRAGYRVVSVRDGLVAWRLFHRNPDAFDLAFVDMILPRMHGRRLGRRIRMMRPALPILYTSGFTPFGEAPDLDRDAGTEFLDKPYRPQALLAAVRRMLGPAKAASAEA